MLSGSKLDNYFKSKSTGNVLYGYDYDNTLGPTGREEALARRLRQLEETEKNSNAVTRLEQYSIKDSGFLGFGGKGTDTYFNEYSRLADWADPYRAVRSQVPTTDPYYQDFIAPFDKYNSKDETVKDKYTGKEYTREQLEKLTLSEYADDVENYLKSKGLDTAYAINETAYNLGKATYRSGLGFAKNTGLLDNNIITRDNELLKESIDDMQRELAKPYASQNEAIAQNVVDIGGNIALTLGLAGAGMALPTASAVSAGVSTLTKTNDLKEIATNSALAAGTALVFQGTIGKLNKILPEANYLSTIFLRNAAVGAGAGYGATTYNRAARNLIKQIEGKPVTSQDWLETFWGSDVGWATAISALTYGATTTKATLDQYNALCKALSESEYKFYTNLTSGNKMSFEQALKYCKTGSEAITDMQNSKYGKLLGNRGFEVTRDKWDSDMMELLKAYYGDKTSSWQGLVDYRKAVYGDIEGSITPTTNASPYSLLSAGSADISNAITNISKVPTISNPSVSIPPTTQVSSVPNAVSNSINQVANSNSSIPQNVGQANIPMPQTASRINIPTPPIPNQAIAPTLPTTSSEDVAPTQGNQGRQISEGQQEYLKGGDDSKQKQTSLEPNKITANKSLDYIRDFKEVGKRNINAYQYDNPEVKPFFQYEAYQLLNDLNNSIRGERYATEDEYGNLIWGGNKRNTVSDIAELLDGENGVKLSYADIRKGLEAIIKDEGSENIAAAKRIEMVLDRRLREGYTDIEGYNHDPSENYKKFLNGEEYVAPEQYDYEQLVKEYGEPGANVDNTLSSLSEEEAREVSNYIDEIYADTELDDEYKTNIANRLTNVENFEEYKNIKNEVNNYKKQIQTENRSVAKANEVIPKEVPEEAPSQESTQEMPQANANTPAKYIPKTKRKLLEDFEHVGYIDVNGKVIKSADDLADLAQIFRDPTVETFRILLTGEDKKVLTQLAYTSYLPDRVDLNVSEVIDEINSAIKKYNASKLWLLHNHPTGDVTPSKADQTTTTEIISKLPKGLKRLFGGHVIIDHNKYSLITQNNQMLDGIEVKSDIPLRKETFNNIEDHFSKEGWVGFKAGTPDTVAEIASDINNNPNYSTLVFVDTKLKAVALQEVPNKFLNNTDKYINNYLKRLGRQNGAAKVFVASQSSDVISNLANKNLNIQDAVLYEQTEDGGLRVVTSNLRDSKMKGNEIFVDREPARKLTAKKDTPSLRVTPDEEKETLKAQNKDLEKELRASKRENEKTQRENNNLQNKIQKQQETFKKQKEQLNTKMENELQKQKEAFEKRTERTKKATEAREKKEKETRAFNKLSPEKKLDKLVPKAEQQLEDYAKAEYPKLSEDFEKKFGTTIREIISALSNSKIMSQLPDKLKELITNYKSETYLKANWKTFDKYLKEAIAEKQVQDIINNSNMPVSDRLLRLLESHKQAPVIMQSAADLKEELNDLVELVNAVKASLTFAKSNEKIDKVRENIRKELEPIIEKNQKNHLSKNEKIDNVTNILGKIGKSVGEVLSYLPTRIQMLMDGNPDSALKILWDNVERGSETEMRLEVEKDRLFSKFFENPNDLNSKLKGELQKDFARDNWEDTKTPLGRLTRLMMMSIYGMTMNTDNLMHITPVLLGVTESGTPVYSKPGGLIIPEERAYKRGDIATAYANGKAVALTMEDINKITSMLTPLEKEFVKTCVQDLADLVAENGNPVSMNLAGRELFHPNYLRIIVSGDALEPEIIDPNAMDNMNTFLSSMDTGLEGRLGRGGSLQARTHKSTRPIYLEDLWNATIRSFEGAKKYISYAEALYDNDLVLKTKFPNTYKKVGTITEAEAKGKTFGDRKYVEVEELPKHGEKTYIIKNGDSYDVYELDQRGRTMESLIDSAGDDKFMKYYKDFVHQLLYGVNSYANDLDKLIGKAAELRAKVVLHANLNVGFSQQLSRPFIMPFLYYPAKSFIQGFMNKKEVYKIAEEYLRNEGKSISGLSKRQVINRYLEYSTYMNSFRDIGNVTHDADFNKPRKTGLGRVDLGKLISINDRMAVDFTFRVLIQDVKNSGFEPGTKEFMQELKRRAWQVARSNPSYLAIYRTPLQMSRTAVARMFFQFQTVMLLGLNNALSNIMASNHYKNSGNKEKAKEYGKRARMSVGALVVSSLLGEVIRKLLQAGFRKEKTDKLAEDILKDTIVKTLSYTIFLDDVLQWFMGEGFDASTNDLSYINQLKDMFGKLGKMITADESKKPSSTIDFLKSVGNVVGIPSNSLENIFVLIGNITGSDFGKEYEVIKDSSKLKKWLDNQEALKDTDMATFYDLYIATRTDQLESKYEYIVDSKAGTYNSKALAMKRAIADTLGYNPKRLSERQQKEVNNYYEIFK